MRPCLLTGASRKAGRRVTDCALHAAVQIIDLKLSIPGVFVLSSAFGQVFQLLTTFDDSHIIVRGEVIEAQGEIEGESKGQIFGTKA